MKGCLLVLVFVEAAMAAMLLQSPVFKNFESIPADYGCDWKTPNRLIGPSPPLEWYRTPEKTRSFLLVVDDINSDGNVHWLVSNIPADTISLEKDASRYTMPLGTMEYYNTFGDIGFGLMCPINTTHIFRFRLYALRIPKFEFKSYHKYHVKFPITLDKVEEQIDAIRDDVIYVATLAGKMYVQGYDPQYVDYSSPVLIGPVETIRYVKPSETLKNKRSHNSPRPLGNTTKAEICRRYIAGNLPPVYTQLCNASSPMAAHFAPRVDGGGPEQPAAPAAAVVLVAHREEQPETPTAVAARDTVPSGAVSTGATRHSTTPEEDAAAQAKELENPDLLVQWDCGSKLLPNENNNPLRLRSAAIDLCGAPDTTMAVLPSEFMCDDKAPHLARASPPLTWRLDETAAADGKCKVGSYVVMMEELRTNRIGWLVKDIPPSVTHLDVGISGETGNTFGVEQLNTYKTDKYVAPCPSDASPATYRFHVYARPLRETQLLGSDSAPATEIANQMADSCYSAFLDFAAVKASV